MREMLTEPQFKVLMILLDNKGHAGWQLAEDLEMKVSNLNPYLKDLEKRKFVIQGPPRKSMKPKKREGDYKEYPYYLNKDLGILGSIIKEMIVTNRLYDIGFPFRIIETSNYIKLMKDMFKEDLNKCLVGFTGMEHYDRCVFDSEHVLEKLQILVKETQADGPDDLDSFSDIAEVHLIRDEIVTTKSLKRLERWYGSYLDKHQDQELGRPDSD